MTAPPKGIKKQVLGGMLVCLGAITTLLADVIGFELDIFYAIISVIGTCLFLYGTLQKNWSESMTQRVSIGNNVGRASTRHVGLKPDLQGVAHKCRQE